MAKIREDIFDTQTSCGMFPEKQKSCHKGSKGTEERLYIDQQILNERKMRRKNLAIAGRDYKNHMVWSRKA